MNIDVDLCEKRAWVEIDLGAIEHNFDIVRRQVGGAKICCVVKANAYGCGVSALAKVYRRKGADYFAVANITEALQLRCEGITEPILVLGYTDVNYVGLLAAQNISQCVFSCDYSENLAREARKQNVSVKVHMKLDTGMGRIGWRYRDAEKNEFEAIYEACRQPNFITEGIFTHFASADEGEGGREFTKTQLRLFELAVSRLEERGVRFDVRHCANSAAIFECPEAHMDMVRAGIVLYGLKPSDEVCLPEALIPVLQLKTVVSHVKTVAPGESIGYGRAYIAGKTMKIATLPIGYADGLWRSNGGRAAVEINGRPAPIVGRVCMDQCMVDVSDVEGVGAGAIAVVYGRQSYNRVDVIAKNNNTIGYEILCAISARCPRKYVSGAR